jgi:putative Holliday junction resolvase
MGRLLCLDHGIKRIGVAVSDANRLVARELHILTRQSKQEDFVALNTIAQQEGVVAIVVGIPYSDAPDGVHTQADTVRLWISRFQETTKLPIIEWDEQLTSDDARDIAKYLRRKPTDPIDDLAARVILQSYLDALRDGLATLPPHPAP